MIKIVIASIAGLALVGCSSSPKVSAKKPQYCYTSQTIENKNGERVNSTTMVECSDDEVKRLFHVRSGMAPNCGVFTYWTKIGGQDVQRKGISCQKPDGSWEVVNTSGY
jgi:hypothetical protein